MVITDGLRSYAVFIYQCGLLQWSSLFGEDNAVIGYNMRGQFINHPLSGTSLATNVACTNSPATSRSTLVYAIGGLESDLQRSRVECLRRYIDDIARFGNNIQLYYSFAAPCPCTLFQAITDIRYYFESERSIFGSMTCYTQRFPTFFGGGQLCCYESK